MKLDSYQKFIGRSAKSVILFLNACCYCVVAVYYSGHFYFKGYCPWHIQKLRLVLALFWLLTHMLEHAPALCLKMTWVKCKARL